MTESPAVIACLRAATGLHPAECRVLWHMYRHGSVDRAGVAKALGFSVTVASTRLCDLRDARPGWLTVQHMRHLNNTSITALNDVGRAAIRDILAKASAELLEALSCP